MRSHSVPYVHRYVTDAGLTPGSTDENIAAQLLIRAGHLKTGDLTQQHQIGRYKIDLAWPNLKVGLEVDGPHHFAPYNAARDHLRDSELRSQGWLIFRADSQLGGDGLRDQVAFVSRAVLALKAGGY